MGKGQGWGKEEGKGEKKTEKGSLSKKSGNGGGKEREKEGGGKKDEYMYKLDNILTLRTAAETDHPYSNPRQLPQSSNSGSLPSRPVNRSNGNNRFRSDRTDQPREQQHVMLPRAGFQPRRSPNYEPQRYDTRDQRPTPPPRGHVDVYNTQTRHT